MRKRRRRSVVDVHWIDLAQVTVKQRDVLNMIIKFQLA
jgi:hypothetical protein